ncbi:MAG: hypothetical protein ACK53T_00240 [Planctomycetota bacterium]|jgi:hypothetical protein
MIEPKTWNEAARAALLKMGCDDNVREITASYRELYDSNQHDALARKAMAELNKMMAERGWDVDKQVALLVRKQHDYGHENINRFGVRGVEVRLWDKISRYENLKKRGGKSKNEPLTDTLADIIGYSAIVVMLQHGWFTLGLEGDK